ncbi:MAG TPA: glycoside hydrolase family 9 protein [Acidobacteriaceae bacterium]
MRVRRWWWIAAAGAMLPQLSLGAVKVLVDQVGYETNGEKRAVIVAGAQDRPGRFSLIDAKTGETVASGELMRSGAVDAWTGMVFWTADFSGWKRDGRYRLEIRGDAGAAESCEFVIEDDVLERNTLSNVVFYFKGQRSSGLIDSADRRLTMPKEPGSDHAGDRSGTVLDLHGGWYDATGDYGIHLSHQNPTSYFNPQQIPLTAWSLLKSYQTLLARGSDNFTEYERRMLDEGLFGADYMTRLKRPEGSFLESITGPGPGKLPQDREIGNPNWRTRIKTKAGESTERIAEAVGTHPYESSFRAGGGMAIAALALASTMPADGELKRSDYLRAAEEAFAFLQEHNRELLNDGAENILDDYCALMAATELFKATHDEKYRVAAKARAEKLMGRLVREDKWKGSWRADDGTRPFFHPSDAGLPVVSLLEYAAVAGPEEKAKIRDVVRESLAFEMQVTGEVNNPFGYARQLVWTKSAGERTAFFFPHDTEAAPWWQGEDARIASLAAAARMALPLFADDAAFQKQLREYAWNQLHWILGRNPYDTSLLMGSGHGDAAYMFFKSYKYANPPGAIVNGITSALNDEHGIAWNQGFAVTGKDEDWRWTETWLPHGAWYLYAVSLPH